MAEVDAEQVLTFVFLTVLGFLGASTGPVNSRMIGERMQVVDGVVKDEAMCAVRRNAEGREQLSRHGLWPDGENPAELAKTLAPFIPGDHMTALEGRHRPQQFDNLKQRNDRFGMFSIRNLLARWIF